MKPYPVFIHPPGHGLSRTYPIHQKELENNFFYFTHLNKTIKSPFQTKVHDNHKFYLINERQNPVV